MSGHQLGRIAGAQRQAQDEIRNRVQNEMQDRAEEAPRSLLLDLMFAGAIFMLVTGVAMTTAAVASYAWSLLY